VPKLSAVPRVTHGPLSTFLWITYSAAFRDAFHATWIPLPAELIVATTLDGTAGTCVFGRLYLCWRY